MTEYDSEHIPVTVDDSVEVLVISGTVGAGKTEVGAAVHRLLKARGEDHVYMDLDMFANAYPLPDLNERPEGRIAPPSTSYMARKVAGAWNVDFEEGHRKVILTRVIEDEGDLYAIQQAIRHARITVLLVESPRQHRVDRLHQAAVGIDHSWSLAESDELAAKLAANGLHHGVVLNDDRSSVQIAIDAVRVWSRNVAERPAGAPFGAHFDR